MLHCFIVKFLFGKRVVVGAYKVLGHIDSRVWHILQTYVWAELLKCDYLLPQWVPNVHQIIQCKPKQQIIFQSFAAINEPLVKFTNFKVTLVQIRYYEFIRLFVFLIIGGKVDQM